jgi:hypothetical protein
MEEGIMDETTITPEQVAAYHESGQKLLSEHPDVNARLNQMAAEGFNLHPAVVPEIVKRNRADVTVWLASKEGEHDAHQLFNVAHSRKRSIEELDRLQARLDKLRPFADYEPPRNDTDKYLEKRRQDIKSGKRLR